ncbi:preprotein translocase subunit SecF [Amaricoccus macauensis]|uniref:Protein-export membrane protein SecF n=1 Tax=Amaricoccus macauensis TaxID=57001 RepID=A0A840SM00_9RHOB|nr:protein translocase subunit SecF [Amaricoccus macauensis]MBB5223007.1 preprotein translocase subunit SecF [Amaricoccus macauensis]
MAFRLRLVPDDTKINFFSRTAMRFWLGLSVLGMVASIVLYFTMGLNYGVDFRGGTIATVQTQEDVTVGEFREALTTLNLGDVAVTNISDDSGQGRNLLLMRLGISGDDPDSQQALVAQVRTSLAERFPGIQFLQIDSVGAKVSSELVRNGVLAVVLSFIGIGIYVWLRYEWQFALGAVASLVHDALVTVGIFCLFQIEFDLTIIAAILTVLGYSINDTVVVFDRVREVLRKYKKLPLPEVMNIALNETLSRTVMTSVTTLIALFAIYFFGGEVLSGFAFAVIFGVVVGTYSSIYVASAVVIYFGVKRDWSSKQDGNKAGTTFSGAKV